MVTLEATCLFSEFTRRVPELAAGSLDLVEEFRKLQRLIQDVEKYVVLAFPEYTPHDHLHHFDGLFALADRILGRKTYDRLGTAELCLLVFGLYAHDWGMAVPQSELDTLFNGGSQQDSVLLLGEPEEAEEFISDAVSNGVLHEVALRDYIRQTHAARSGARLRKTLQAASRVFADAVAKIAEGHTLDIRDVRDPARYPWAQSVFGETVNIAAITTFVRMIDLLDIGDNRTPFALWKFVSPLNDISRMEWEKHRALSAVAVNESNSAREIVVSGWTDDPTVFSALADLRSWVDRQFTECLGLLRAMPGKYHPGLDSRIAWNVEAVGFSPVAIRFECERGPVLGLLSEELYKHDRLAFLRELLQNSVDAIDTREILLRDSGLALTGTINVKLSSKPGCLSLEWGDNGIGMDEHILSGYFASVGRTWYNSREANRIGETYPVSQFGVGVLSFFSASERILVTTRRDPHAGGNSSGMAVDIPGRDSHFRIRPASNLHVGTTVQLEIVSRADAETPISTESIVKALIRISRFVRHSVVIDVEGTKIDLASQYGGQNEPGIQITGMRGQSAQRLLESCKVVDVAFGDESKDVYGTYSAVIPTQLDSVYEQNGYREWQVGRDRVSLEDIVTDTEQAVFTKGIRAGEVEGRHTRRSELHLGARHTDWISPKIFANVRNPSLVKFDLSRSHARISSDTLLNEVWRDISRGLNDQVWTGEMTGPTQTASVLGAFASFGAVPDVGLRALVNTERVPLLIVGTNRGTDWKFLGDFLQGLEFFEVPFEVAYASGNAGRALEKNALRGWEGENALLPAEGWSSKRPPWVRHLLSFAHDTLTRAGWAPFRIQLVTPPPNESVPLVCRVWGQVEQQQNAIRNRSGSQGMRWAEMRYVFEQAPELLMFPSNVSSYAAIGSRYWNLNHPKIRSITSSLLKLTRVSSAGRLPAEKARLFAYLTSNSFFGYTVPSRLSGPTLAIEVPNRLLELTHGEEFSCSERLVAGDFFPGTLDGYRNPYHYKIADWELLGTGLGQPLQL